MVSPLLLLQIFGRRGGRTTSDQEFNTVGQDPEPGGRGPSRDQTSHSASPPTSSISTHVQKSNLHPRDERPDRVHGMAAEEQGVGVRNGDRYAEGEDEGLDELDEGDEDIMDENGSPAGRRTHIAIHDSANLGGPRTSRFRRPFQRMDSFSSGWSWRTPRPPGPGRFKRALISLKNFVFQVDPEADATASYVPNYRYLPILSGVLSPFAILLEIPGLTEHWYVRTENNKQVDYRPNPVIIDVAMGVSMFCGVVANAALIVRFLENRVKLMTYVCIAFLVLHDIINAVTVIVFGIIHRFDDGFTYGEAFWMCLCSTIFSITVVGTLVFDMLTTPDFAQSGSGLTRKQRSLVIMVMILICYTALGSLVFSLIMNLSFQDGLYYTVVSIETIGFGDITPQSTAAIVFCIFYSTIGIVNVGLVVNITRETVIEAFENAYRKRAAEVAKRRHEIKLRRIEARERRQAIEKELLAAGLPLYVQQEVSHSPRRTLGGHGGRGGGGVNIGLSIPTVGNTRMVLNEKGLEEWKKAEKEKPVEEVEAVRVDGEVLDGEFASDEKRDKTLAAATELKAEVEALKVEQLHQQPIDGDLHHHDDEHAEKEESYAQFRLRIANDEKKEFLIKLTVAWSLFVTFWVVGAGIFSATEKWGFGRSMYFCWMSFSTIGYGEITPKTPAGKAIFVVWALMGVAAMTILIAVLSEAYSSRYKSALQKGSVKKAINDLTHQHNDSMHSLHEHEFPMEMTKSTKPSEFAQKILDSARTHLDPLPVDVIHHAKTFHEHVRYFTNPNHEAPPKGLNDLLDEIAVAEKLDDRMRQDVLKDDEARRTLFIVSYERAFRKLVDVAEHAVQAIAHKDAELQKLVDVLKEREQRRATREVPAIRLLGDDDDSVRGRRPISVAKPRSRMASEERASGMRWRHSAIGGSRGTSSQPPQEVEGES